MQSKNLNNLVINKVASQEIYDYLLDNNQINDDELYLVEGNSALNTAAIQALIAAEMNKISLGVNPNDQLLYAYYGDELVGTGIYIKGISGKDPSAVGVVEGTTHTISLYTDLTNGTYTLKYEDANDTALTNFSTIGTAVPDWEG